MDITFFEYRSSNRYSSVTPAIVEYDEMIMPEPAFNHTLGTKAMYLGIVLDLKKKINNLSKYMIKSLEMHSTLAQEPKSTEEATQCIIRILDARYEMADLQAIVNNNCSHLNSNKQNLLLEFF